MKKIIIIIIGVLLIGGLAYYASNLSKGAKATDISLIAFAIEDTASVNKIEIYDSYNDIEYTVERNKEGVWVGENGECVRQDVVIVMLETMNRIMLRGYVPQSATQNMKKLLMAQHKRVKIYQNGKWVKTWYVGHSTRDRMGTHMLLETPTITSDNPVIMGMKGFFGILEPRFFADPRRFTCTNLFSFKREDLGEIEVINRVNPTASFKVEVKNADEYLVTSNGEIVNQVDRNNLVFYLNGFEDVHFNQPNYTMSEAEIDSLRNVSPDYELKIKTKQNEDFNFKMYRRLDPEYDTKDTIAYDEDYLWGFTKDDELVRLQYYTVGPLIQGKIVFVKE